MDLERHIETIPHMGGRRIAPFLRQIAREARPNTNIVELGCWLGAGTAQLAMGLRERESGHGVTIHCFDNFHGDVILDVPSPNLAPSPKGCLIAATINQWGQVWH